MKTKEELDEIKMEVENLGKKLNELTDDELNEVTGGQRILRRMYCQLVSLSGSGMDIDSMP